MDLNILVVCELSNSLAEYWSVAFTKVYLAEVSTLLYMSCVVLFVADRSGYGRVSLPHLEDSVWSTFTSSTRWCSSTEELYTSNVLRWMSRLRQHLVSEFQPKITLVKNLLKIKAKKDGHMHGALLYNIFKKYFSEPSKWPGGICEWNRINLNGALSQVSLISTVCFFHLVWLKTSSNGPNTGSFWWVNSLYPIKSALVNFLVTEPLSFNFQEILYNAQRCILYHSGTHQLTVRMNERIFTQITERKIT